MNKLFTVVSLFILSIPNILSAQDNLDFNFDYARFNYDSTSVYLEVYYSFKQDDLTIVEKDGNKFVEGIIHIEMSDSASGEYFLNKDWKVKNIVKESTNPAEKSLIGLVSMVVPKGVYNVVVEGRDFNNENIKKTLKDKISIEPFGDDKVIISDIQLSSNIQQEGANPNSIFYKNTLEVIPNPAMLYSESAPVMFYYSEFYNLLKGQNPGSMKMEKLLFNGNGRLFYNKSKMLKSKDNAVVECGTLNLKKYPTDTYNFVITLVDTTTKKAVVSNKKFFLYNPNVVDTFSTSFADAGVLGSEFGVFTEEECEYMFNVIKYIAHSTEIDQFEALDSLSTKREFLYNFWKQRDPDLNTLRNEFKEDYMSRAEYVTRNFGNKYRDGYKTERGRIYLVYGEPDQRDRFPNEPNVKPYEIWFYNDVEGGVQFVFGDMTGFSNYELIHSTKRGELRDEDWSRRLRTN